MAWITQKTNKIPDKESAPSTLGHRRSLEYLRMPHFRLPFARVLTARASKQTWRASAPQVEIQPEVKVKSRGRKRERRRERHRERERHRGSQIPKKPGRETSSRNWPKKLVREAGPRNWPPPLLFRRPFILLIKHGDQWVTQNYVAFATQILSVYHFVYKRSQVIYIILWPTFLNEC